MRVIVKLYGIDGRLCLGAFLVAELGAVGCDGKHIKDFFVCP